MENCVFPIVTKKIQEAFEQEQKGKPDETPDICGYYGRACRQMGKADSLIATAYDVINFLRFK